MYYSTKAMNNNNEENIVWPWIPPKQNLRTATGDSMGLTGTFKFN